MTVQAVKVLLVEDSAVLAERISEVLIEIPEIELVGVVDTESQALSEIRQRRIHIVVLDLHLMQGNGFGILRTLHAAQSKPCIVVLTNHDSEEYERHALALGASHFLDKARDFEELPGLLKEIVKSIHSPPA